MERTGRDAALLIYQMLEHDLHYRAATFAPDQRYTPASLRGALPLLRDALGRWPNAGFDAIELDVKSGLRKEIDRQFETHGRGHAEWRDQLLRVFSKVEYVVNARLLYTLAYVPETALHSLIQALMGRQLGGTALGLPAREPRVRHNGSAPSYHIVQDDGILVGDGALVMLELKAIGKTTGTKFDAAQLTKFAWRARHLELSTESKMDMCLLVLLPEVGGRLAGVATDIRWDALGHEPSIADRCNAPFAKFIGSPQVKWQRRDAEEAVSALSRTARSYREVAETARRVLPSAYGAARASEAEFVCGELDKVAAAAVE